jgi:hypothetical protein
MTGAEGFWTRLTTRAQQGLCGLHGHDALLHFGDGRISLLCTSCGHETPGWEVEGSPLARRATAIIATRQVQASTHRVVRLPAAHERQVA